MQRTNSLTLCFLGGLLCSVTCLQNHSSVKSPPQSVDIHLKQAATHFLSVFANIFQYSCHHHHPAHFQNKAALQDSVKEKSLAMIFQQLFRIGWKHLSFSVFWVLVCCCCFWFCCCCFSPPATHCIFRSLALPQSRNQLSEWIHILVYFLWSYFCLFLFLISISIILLFGYILHISFGYTWSSRKEKPRDLFLYLFYDTKAHYQGPNREPNIPRPHNTSIFFSFR